MSESTPATRALRIPWDDYLPDPPEFALLTCMILAAAAGLALWRKRRLPSLVLLTLAGFLAAAAAREQTQLLAALTAAGTVAAGVFAAVAAHSAQIAATQSNETAGRAREALSRTIKPTVDVGVHPDMVGTGEISGTVGLTNSRPLVDGKVTFYLRDGSTRSIGDIELRPEPGKPHPHVRLSLGHPQQPWTSVEHFAQRAVLEYSDESRILRWRYSVTFETEDEYQTRTNRPRGQILVGHPYPWSDEPIR